MGNFLESVLHYFWLVHEVNEFWPNATTTGFAISLAVAALVLPILLNTSLWMIYATSGVGKKFKLLSTILIFVVGVPLYITITALLLAVIWIIVGFLVLAVAMVGPIAASALICFASCSFAWEFVNEQSWQHAEAEDITCIDLIRSLFVGVLSMLTWGVAACGLTLLKMPIVFLACICHVVYYSTTAFKESGGWCPLVFLGWCFAFACGIVVFGLVVAVSALAKLMAGMVWPTYVTAGWLWGIGRRRQDSGCCAWFLQGMKAGYQVVWAGDLLTNAFIIGDFELMQQTATEFKEIALGTRTDLNPECRRVSWLPPVTIGLFRGSWDIAETVVARDLGVSKETVTQAWESFEKQMSLITQDAITSGLLTEQYVHELPPSLIIGLPARALLDTIERSTGKELKLANGLTITNTTRPRGPFADKVWMHLRTAKLASEKLPDLSLEARSRLSRVLLAGGGDPSELTPSLAKAVKDFEQLPQVVREPCVEVQRPLIALALECSRQPAFRERISKVFGAFEAAHSSKQPVPMPSVVLAPTIGASADNLDCLSCGGGGCGLCRVGVV